MELLTYINLHHHYFLKKIVSWAGDFLLRTEIRSVNESTDIFITCPVLKVAWLSLVKFYIWKLKFCSLRETYRITLLYNPFQNAVLPPRLSVQYKSLEGWITFFPDLPWWKLFTQYFFSKTQMRSKILTHLATLLNLIIKIFPSERRIIEQEYFL